MKLLDRILRRESEAELMPDSESVERGCQHVALVANWDEAADIGVDARASRYVCGACGTTFSAEEGRRLRETEAERLRAAAGN